MDRGAWRATVHRVTKSQTRLKQLSMHALVLVLEMTGLKFDSQKCSPVWSPAWRIPAF